MFPRITSSSFSFPQELTDTRFPFSKRPLNEEQEIEGSRSLKRQRMGPSPVEHRKLAAIKKLEREAARKQMKNICPAHQTVLVDTPQLIMKQLQAQGVTLHKTTEALDALSEQVSDLKDCLTSAVRSFNQHQQETRPIRPIPVNPAILSSYYNIVFQTLEKVRQFRTTESTGDYLPSQDSAASQCPLIRTAFECMSKIRDLILLQCNFDCFAGGINGSNDVLTFNCSFLPAPINTVAIQPITWERAYMTVQRMEFNLRTYMERLGIFPGRPSNSQTLSQISARSLMIAPKPLFTSTPKTRHLGTTTSIMRKRKNEDGAADMDKDLGDRSTLDIERRLKLTPRKLSFSFGHNASMEVDD